MMNTLTDIKKGDEVRFLGTTSTFYDSTGDEVYGGLEVGKVYTVKNSFIVGLTLEEISGMFLKEHFRKIRI